MFVNVRSRTQVVHRVRAGITLDVEPMRAGEDLVQPTYIEAVYRFDSLSLAEDHEVLVTASAIRRNGTVGTRYIPLTWPPGHRDMPVWAALFFSEHKPNPMELI